MAAYQKACGTQDPPLLLSILLFHSPSPFIQSPTSTHFLHPAFFLHPSSSFMHPTLHPPIPSSTPLFIEPSLKAPTLCPPLASSTLLLHPLSPFIQSPLSSTLLLHTTFPFIHPPLNLSIYQSLSLHQPFTFIHPALHPSPPFI